MKADEESEYESYYAESGQEAEDHPEAKQNHKKRGEGHNLSAEQSMNDVKSGEKSQEQQYEDVRPPAVHRKQKR